MQDQEGVKGWLKEISGGFGCRRRMDEAYGGGDARTQQSCGLQTVHCLHGLPCLLRALHSVKGPGGTAKQDMQQRVPNNQCTQEDASTVH
eukprot:1158743-Pelagomonas_calceolata.AAC.10